MDGGETGGGEYVETVTGGEVREMIIGRGSVYLGQRRKRDGGYDEGRRGWRSAVRMKGGEVGGLK